MNRFLMALAVLVMTFSFVGDASAQRWKRTPRYQSPFHRHVPHRTVPRITPTHCTCGRVGTCHVHHRTFRYYVPNYNNGFQLNLGRFQLQFGGQRPLFGPFFR